MSAGLDWATLRAHATNHYGEPPGPALEQALARIFEQHPDALAAEIDRVAADLKAGNVRAGWPVLHARAQRLTTPAATPNARTGSGRDKAIGRAEQWIRNAGCQYATFGHAWDDLTHGLLADHQAEATHQRLEQLWDELQPAAAEAIREHHDRLAATREHNRCAQCGRVRPFTAYRCLCKPAKEAAPSELRDDEICEHGYVRNHAAHPGAGLEQCPICDKPNPTPAQETA